MIKEFFKTIILIILVLSSLVLTVLVWSYETDFSEVETSLSALPNTAQGERVDFARVIRPYQYVWIDGNELSGTQDVNAMNIALREHLDGVSVETLHFGSDLSNMNEMLQDIDSQRILILDFTTNIPSKTFLTTYGIDFEGYRPTGDMSRVIFDLRNNDAVIYLLNKDDQYTSRVMTELPSEDIVSTIEQYGERFENFSSIITNRNNASRLTSIYSPSAPSGMHREVFISSVTSVDVLNQVMFLNNDFTSTNQNGITMYENDDVATYYNHDTYRYLYQNKHEIETASSNDSMTLRKTFDFLNSHRALNRNSILFNYDSDISQLTVRDSLNGKLVFSDEIMNTIIVSDGEEEIYEYQRSQLRTSTQIPSQDLVTLPNIETVRYEIASSDDLSLQYVTNFIVGYNMRFSEEQSELNLVTFTPSWFILYDGEWMRYEDGELN